MQKNPDTAAVDGWGEKAPCNSAIDNRVMPARTGAGPVSLSGD